MNNTLLYNYVGYTKFGLNIPPFTLKIYISNFENMESLLIEEKIDRFEDLPKNITDVLAKSNDYKNYIQNVSIYFFLHFQVELYNNIEKIHNEFFSKQLKEFIF